MFITKKKLAEIEVRLGRIERWIELLESVLIEANPGDEVTLEFTADKELNAAIRGKKLN